MILEHHGTLAQSQIVVTIVHFLTSYYLNTTKVIYQVRFLDINDVKTCHWHLSKSTFQFFGPHFEYIPTYDFDVLQGTLTLVPMYLPDVLKRVEKWKCFFKRFTYWVPVLRIVVPVMMSTDPHLFLLVCCCCLLLTSSSSVHAVNEQWAKIWRK